ncbi:tripartite tricarboxylate transporter substrate binding protein [Comamonas serinivorans]|nr:tripartite tricarboxylate transporter substrate binding protein [Comamonas serinivorans]
MDRRQALGALAGGLGLGLGMESARASTGAWPSKPVRVVVPYAAGGVVDINARAITTTLQDMLGQPFVVEAKPGANGNIAAESVANATPDGHTLLVSASFLINNPLLETGLRWSPQRFVPIARFANSPSYFVVNNDVPAKTVREFVQVAKAAKQPLQYADGGTGTPQSMATLLFQQVAGVQMDAVLYKGAPPSVPDLLQGLVVMAILPATVAIPQVKAGKLRALANMSHQRSLQLPDVPTMAEAGFPEVTTLSWYGLHAPAGTPAAVVERLSTAMKAACALPAVKERFVSAGGEEAYLDTAAFKRFLAQDEVRWKQLASKVKS